MREAQTSMSMKGWDEKTFREWGDGRKLTRVEASFAYEGAMRGEGAALWVLGYNLEGCGSAPALERFEGELDGLVGGFVLQHNSEFDAKSVRDRLEILPGSGTGALAGITGKAELELVGQGPYAFSLRYELP
jgi:hypothetical protein